MTQSGCCYEGGSAPGRAPPGGRGALLTWLCRRAEGAASRPGWTGGDRSPTPPARDPGSPTLSIEANLTSPGKLNHILQEGHSHLLQRESQLAKALQERLHLGKLQHKPQS